MIYHFSVSFYDVTSPFTSERIKDLTCSHNLVDNQSNQVSESVMAKGFSVFLVLSFFSIFF